MDKNFKVKVTNRNNGTVGYIIPEMNNLQRQFAPGVTKEISFEELQNLYWLKGGRVLIENYLIVQDPKVLEALQVDVEPEYFYSDKDIQQIMETGTLDEFLDMLDFANKGVIESIKTLAVDLPLNDVAKREAILKKTGFDVTNAIDVKNIKFDGNEENTATQKKAGRRTTIPNNKENDNTKSKYKVIKE